MVPWTHYSFLQMVMLTLINCLKYKSFSDQQIKKLAFLCLELFSTLHAIFGYSIENNLKGKVEYLVEEMERRVVEELKVFLQYFAFSLDTRTVPRHLHLKERNLDLSLQRMLLWSDQRFYAKWK
ncbi:hypothetical protein IFM89_023822 [Coptis chinensis]|uniref:Uncharacterized protein n=1 Tax=Coptis chinensis TaxID=261450 RepID=A0A835I3K1_9MAGN|nr:hypothetical protein IFM89_023822 [Coptis chinensis]